MNLIRTILDRLSDSFFISVPDKFSTDPLAAAIVAPGLRQVGCRRRSSVPACHRAGGQSTRCHRRCRAPQPSLVSVTATCDEGYWVAELEADTTLTAEYLMLRRFWTESIPSGNAKPSGYLRAAQLPDGGWPIYYGGPSEISASVKAYFALKLSGISGDEPFMLRARNCIRRKGGVVQANVFTEVTLALFDQYDWEGIPHMPVELMFLPKWFYFNIYAISYWSRAVLIPLLIVFAHRPVCRIPKEQGIEELVLSAPQRTSLLEISAVQ